MNKPKSAIENPKSKTQSRKVSPARIAAFEILQKIEKERVFSSALLPVYEENLSTKDRRLCHEITLGVLRNQIYLDKTIEKLTGKKTEKLDLSVLIALRLGLYQIFFTRKIPAYSAINESVNLVYRARKNSAAGLVNAVLRRASREEKIELDFADEIEKISVETSNPRFLIEKWIGQFGLEATEKLAIANNQTPDLVFRLTIKSDAKTLDTLGKIGLNIAESSILPNAWRISGANEILRLYANEGKIYFQDEASQMVAQTIELKSGESFFDVCAAPGSKTTLIGSKLKVRGSNLFVAGDFYEHRVRILQETCRRQAADFVQIARYDAENPLPFADESFDVILVDAPCTGTGTIRHNPEIRYFLRREDFVQLSEKQLKILKNASKLIKRGGRIVYSTCSLEKEENETVCEKFLNDCAEFQKVLPGLPERFLTAENFARTFPHRDDTDGFFIAVFERKKLFG